MTPVEDPCEYDAAWRFSLASYLFSVGVRSKDDFMCLGDKGGIMAAAQGQPRQAGRQKTRGEKKQGKTKKPAAMKVVRPVAPFSEHPEYRSLASDEWVQKMAFLMNEEATGRPRAKASDLWRVVAADLGYDALMTMWGWRTKAHGLKDASLKGMPGLSKAVIAILVNNVLESLCAGAIGHKDAAKMFSAYTALLKLMEDKSKHGSNGELTDSDKALMSILQLVAPKMIIPKEGSPGMITDDEIRGRIAAQQAIENQPIEDAGEHVVHEIIDAQISDKINER